MKLKVGTKLIAKKNVKIKGIVVYGEGKEYVVTSIEDDTYIVSSPTLGTGMFDGKELFKIFKVADKKTFKERIFGK